MWVVGEDLCFTQPQATTLVNSSVEAAPTTRPENRKADASRPDGLDSGSFPLIKGGRQEAILISPIGRISRL